MDPTARAGDEPDPSAVRGRRRVLALQVAGGLAVVAAAAALWVVAAERYGDPGAGTLGALATTVPSAPEPTVPPATAPPVTPPDAGGHDAASPFRDDVEMAGCSLLGYANLMHTVLRVTNGADHRSSYIIEVVYYSPDRTVRLGEGLAFVLDVEPGESVVVESDAPVQIAGAAFACEVGLVDRYQV